MPEDPTTQRSDPITVVVAGLVCLDLIPDLAAGPRGRGSRPGALDPLGPLGLAVGGCVGNTGIVLHRLGLRSILVGRVGDDRLGRLLADLLRDEVPAEDVRLIQTLGVETSYSLITSRPGEDRSIRHFPGANDRFVAADIPDELLREAALVHVGYPPLMAALAADDGRELGDLLSRARRHGAITSLDMANADPGPEPRRWRRLLAAVLPGVDVFLPSLVEAGHLLGRRVRRDPSGAPDLAAVTRLADELLSLGAGIAGVKLGEHGLLVRTADPARLRALGRLDPAAWSERELYSTVFESDVVGTAGSGDATIAGFLFALLAGRTPDEAVTAACAVGGASTEAPDGSSGVPGWPAVDRRLASGWRRRPATPGPGWTHLAQGLWGGPRDAG